MTQTSPAIPAPATLTETLQFLSYSVMGDRIFSGEPDHDLYAHMNEMPYYSERVTVSYPAGTKFTARRDLWNENAEPALKVGTEYSRGFATFSEALAHLEKADEHNLGTIVARWGEDYEQEINPLYWGFDRDPSEERPAPTFVNLKAVHGSTVFFSYNDGEVSLVKSPKTGFFAWLFGR